MACAGTEKPSPWEWWRSIGSPKHVCSPMVDQSELAFRLLLQRLYQSSANEADNARSGEGSPTARAKGLLCYTPMLHSAMFVADHTYRSQRFASCLEEKANGGGLVAQFCGHNPATLLAAAKLVESKVDAVDLNLGCPQNIAQKGNYGSYLMRQGDLVEEIIRTWSTQLAVPATCKVRVFDMKSPKAEERGLQGTINFCKRLEAAGAHALCVHGRTRDQKGVKTGTADWHAIAAVKRAVGVPVIANGGIETPADVARCLAVTGADAVMSAEALLENPTLFNRDDGDGSCVFDHDFHLSFSRHRSSSLHYHHHHLSTDHQSSSVPLQSSSGSTPRDLPRENSCLSSSSSSATGGGGSGSASGDGGDVSSGFSCALPFLQPSYVPPSTNQNGCSSSDSKRLLVESGVSSFSSHDSPLCPPVQPAMRPHHHRTTLLATLNTPATFALAYLDLAAEHPPSDFYKCVKAHVLKLLHRPLTLAARETTTSTMVCVIAGGGPSPPLTTLTTGSAAAAAVIEAPPSERIGTPAKSQPPGSPQAPVAAESAASSEGATPQPPPDSLPQRHPSSSELAAGARAAVLSATDATELRSAVLAIEGFMWQRCAEELQEVGNAKKEKAAEEARAGGGGRVVGFGESEAKGACSPLCRSCGLLRHFSQQQQQQQLSGDLQVSTHAKVPPSAAETPQKDDYVESALCQCWRYQTWYRRHRKEAENDGDNKRGRAGGEDAPSGETDGAANARAATNRRKERRREKYKALGYNL